MSDDVEELRDADAAFAAVAARLLQEPDVELGAGFGSNPGLRTEGKIFAMMLEDDLIVKLPARRCAELIDAGSASAFEIGRRRTKEWARVSRVDRNAWIELATEAHAYVG